MRRLLLAIGLSVVLSGCLATLSHYQLSHLNRGMAPADVAEKLKLPPLITVPVRTDGRSFEMERYLLNNGMGTDVYYLAYENRRLLFWGYVSEFRRHPDPVLGRAVDAATAVPSPPPPNSAGQPK